MDQELIVSWVVDHFYSKGHTTLANQIKAAFGGAGSAQSGGTRQARGVGIGALTRLEKLIANSLLHGGERYLNVPDTANHQAQYLNTTQSTGKTPSDMIANCALRDGKTELQSELGTPQLDDECTCERKQENDITEPKNASSREEKETDIDPQTEACLGILVSPPCKALPLTRADANHVLIRAVFPRLVDLPLGLHQASDKFWEKPVDSTIEEWRPDGDLGYDRVPFEDVESQTPVDPMFLDPRVLKYRNGLNGVACDPYVRINDSHMQPPLDSALAGKFVPFRPIDDIVTSGQRLPRQFTMPELMEGPFMDYVASDEGFTARAVAQAKLRDDGFLKIVENRLLRAEAQKRGLQVSDTDINNGFASAAQMADIVSSGFFDSSLQYSQQAHPSPNMTGVSNSDRQHGVPVQQILAEPENNESSDGLLEEQDMFSGVIPGSLDGSPVIRDNKRRAVPKQEQSSGESEEEEEEEEENNDNSNEDDEEEEEEEVSNEGDDIKNSDRRMPFHLMYTPGRADPVTLLDNVLRHFREGMGKNLIEMADLGESDEDADPLDGSVITDVAPGHEQILPSSGELEHDSKITIETKEEQEMIIDKALSGTGLSEGEIPPIGLSPTGEDVPKFETENSPLRELGEEDEQNLEQNNGELYSPQIIAVADDENNQDDGENDEHIASEKVVGLAIVKNEKAVEDENSTKEKEEEVIDDAESTEQGPEQHHASEHSSPDQDNEDDIPPSASAPAPESGSPISQASPGSVVTEGKSVEKQDKVQEVREESENAIPFETNGEGPFDAQSVARHRQGIQKPREMHLSPLYAAFLARGIDNPQPSLVVNPAPYNLLDLPCIFTPYHTGFEPEKEIPLEAGSILGWKYRMVRFLGSAAFSNATECEDLSSQVDVSLAKGCRGCFGECCGACRGFHPPPPVGTHELSYRLVCVKTIKNEKDYVDQSLDEIKLLIYVNKYTAALRRAAAKTLKEGQRMGLSSGEIAERIRLKTGFDPRLLAPGEEYDPPIVSLLDYFYSREHLHLVFELLGPNLYEFDKGYRDQDRTYLTLDHVREIARQALDGLRIMHCLGLIHSDIKPENILVKYAPKYGGPDSRIGGGPDFDPRYFRIKLVDLGSSSFVFDELHSYVQSRSYRAPEVLLGLPYGTKIDIWSLGCVLVEMLTGDVLFLNDTIQTLLCRVIGLCGPIPRNMVLGGKLSYRYFTRTLVPFEKVDKGNYTQYFYLRPRRTSFRARTGVSDPLFLDFISHLLTIDPDQRYSAEQALLHPFILAGTRAEEQRD